MASSPYFFLDSTRRPSLDRSEPPPGTPSNLHSHRNHHENSTVETPFPGFQTPARDAGLRSMEISPFLSRAERSPSFGRSTEYGGAGTGGYGGGGTGGKLRSARKQTKRTPYERPPTGRHATAGGSAATIGISSSTGGSRSIASKIRDSASRLLTSSASYLFSSLFKRRPLGIRSNEDSEKEQNEGNNEAAKVPVDSINEQNGIALEEFDGIERVTGKLDIVQVEEVLKQRTWSRDQVNRLTEILQSRLNESSYTKPNSNSYVSPNVKGFMESPKETESSTPVQVARAYMEDQGARPVGISTSSLHTPLPLQSSVQGRGLEDQYNSCPRTLPRTSGTIRMLKRSFALDEELPSVGHARRVRQKTSIIPASPYLYSRQIGGSSTWTQKKTTFLIPKSSETALKILETLDKFSPSPKPKALTEKSPASRRLSPSAKGKSLDENMAKKSPVDQQIPETSKDGEQSWRRSPSKVTYSKSPETISNSEKLDLGLNNHDATQYPVTESQLVEKSRGFRMSAMFEESVSDEECKVDVEPRSSTREAATLKKPSSITTASDPASEVSVPTSNSLPSLVQPNAVMVKSESIPFNASPPWQQELPSTVEKPPSALLTPVSTGTSTSVWTLPVEMVNVATSTSPSITGTQGEQLHLSAVSFSSASTLTSEPSSKVSDFKVAGVSSSPSSFKPIFQAQTSVTTLSEPVLSDKVDNISSAPLSLGPEYTKIPQGTDQTTEAQNGFTMATEGLISDKGCELDTMATDAMAEETAPSSIAAFPSEFMPVTSSTSTFAFGGSPMSSSSAFSFTSPSSSTSSSVSSFSASTFAFGGQTSSSLSQVSMKASGLPLDSISTPSSSSFVFGSSSSSTSGLFTSNASGSSSLTVSSASPFQFGAPTASSSSNLSSSSAASTSSPFGFVSSSSSSPSIGSSATPFSFGGASASVTQASSSATIAQPFTFGATQSNPSMSSSTMVSNSSPNPFAPSGTSSTIPFQFASSTTASASAPPTTFGFGSTNVLSTASASVFSFGASSTPAAAPMVASSEPAFSFASSSTFSFGNTGTTLSPSSSSVFGSSNTISFGSTNNNSSPSSNAFTFGANPFGGGQPSATPMFGGSTAQPTFGSSQPAAQLTFGSSQPAAQPTFGSSQPAAQPTFGSSQPAAQPTFGSSQPAFGSSQPAAQLTFGSSQPAAQPTFGSAQPMFGSTQPTFGLAQPTTMASFGQTQPTTPSQFTFGGMNTTSGPQQAPFAFGGQPGMPTQNPFSAGAGSQPAADFAGGFALGATGGGERNNRKFIKAKRTGAAKRGGK